MLKHTFVSSSPTSPTRKSALATVPQGYENLSYTVRIKGKGTKEQFAEVHKAVMATSPNFYNLSCPVVLKPALVSSDR